VSLLLPEAPAPPPKKVWKKPPVLLLSEFPGGRWRDPDEGFGRLELELPPEGPPGECCCGWAIRANLYAKGYMGPLKHETFKADLQTGHVPLDLSQGRIQPS